MAALGLSAPQVAELGGFGKLIHSGLTDRSQRILEDAYTPGRNMLFLLTAAAYAERTGANAVAIGLLHDQSCIFEDQSSDFLKAAENLLRNGGRPSHENHCASQGVPQKRRGGDGQAKETYRDLLVSPR